MKEYTIYEVNVVGECFELYKTFDCNEAIAVLMALKNHNSFKRFNDIEFDISVKEVKK